MSRSCRAWLALVAFAATWPCAAADDLATCARIDDANARLACYDRVSGRVPPVRSKDVPAPAEQAARAEANPSPESKSSLLGKRWLLDRTPDEKPVEILYHNPNYFIGHYSDNVNSKPASPTHDPDESSELPDVNPGEAKFQLSFKARLLRPFGPEDRFALWAAYTQQSHWQIGNATFSRPFRETDYQPELILAYRVDRDVAGWRWRLLNVGLVHQSNGRENPFSRSWNRIYAQFGVERGNFAVLLRPWYRLPESYESDDNPDIHRYFGSGDIVLVYKTDRQALALTARGNPATGRGAAQLEWSTPLFGSPFRLYIQAFTGYGESLIDYNWRQNSIGVGVSLNDVL
jgi:phospholipase A1